MQSSRDVVARDGLAATAERSAGRFAAQQHNHTKTRPVLTLRDALDAHVTSADIGSTSMQCPRTTPNLLHRALRREKASKCNLWVHQRAPCQGLSRCVFDVNLVADSLFCCVFRACLSKSRATHETRSQRAAPLFSWARMRVRVGRSDIQQKARSEHGTSRSYPGVVSALERVWERAAC